MASKNTVTIYGCGGTGVNLLRKVMKTDLSDFAMVNDVYIDGSRSNSLDVPPSEEKHWYFLENVDGAGKVRKTNYVITDRAISDVIVKHKPSGLNIVVFSASGGSGSVIGPKIAEALWEQQKAVLLFVVGSDESAIAAGNTLKTLASLSNVAVNNGEFANVCYDSNEGNSRNADVDSAMITGIRAVLDLYSGNHFGLDTADIHMWARPNVSAGLAPRLALLDISSAREDIADIVAPISVAELYSAEEAQQGTVAADYNTYGKRTVRGKESLYFALYTQGLDKVFEDLNNTVEGYKERAAARDRKEQNTAVYTGPAEKDGMVL